MIKISYNSKFKEYIGEGVLMEATLADCQFESLIVDAQIVNHEGGYFLDFLKPKGKLSPDLQDTTGNEAFYNDLQVVDYINTEIDIRSGLIQTVKYSLILASKLSSIPSQDFSILITFNGDYDNITFYGNRDGETYIDGDLEKMFFPTFLIEVKYSE